MAQLCGKVNGESKESKGPKEHLADACVPTKHKGKPFNPTKSYAGMSTPWSLGNVYTAESCKGEERVPDAVKWGPVV
jgi:hypothetical protein